MNEPMSRETESVEQAVGKGQEAPLLLLRVYLFGEFQLAWQVPSGMEEAAWNSRTSARALFKLLLCAPGRQATKSALAGILWPETDEQKARESLRSACKVLRKVLRTADGEELLEQRNNGEILKLAEQRRLWVDADAFEDLVAQASRTAVPEEALVLWQQAKVVLRGELLADDQDAEWASHRWVKQRRQALWMGRCRMIRHLADLYIQHGHISLAEETLEQHIVRFPTDQDALYRLLVLLEQQRCFEQACMLYERTRRVLEATGKQPAKHVRAYYEHLQGAAKASEHLRGAESQEMNALRRKILQELLGLIPTILALSTGTEHLLTPEPWERLLAATSEPTVMNANTFNYYLQLVEACWGLCNTGETGLAQQVLESFLPRMIQLASRQSEAALVAAQGLRLQSILCAHQLRLAEMVPPSQLAVAFARQSHGPDSLSAALNGLAVAYKYAGDVDASFTTYQEALAYSAQASPLLRSRVYAGSASMFAQRGRFQEALFYIGLAYESFPDHPESDPHVLSADNGIYMLAYYQGLMYLAMNQPEEADKAFESYKRHPLGGTIPERNRLEIINHQGRAAIMAKDLDKYLACLREGITGATALKSKKRFEEAVTIYQRDVPKQWHHETAIKQMVEQFQLPTGAE